MLVSVANTRVGREQNPKKMIGQRIPHNWGNNRKEMITRQATTTSNYKTTACRRKFVNRTIAMAFMMVNREDIDGDLESRVEALAMDPFANGRFHGWEWLMQEARRSML